MVLPYISLRIIEPSAIGAHGLADASSLQVGQLLRHSATNLRSCAASRSHIQR